MRFLRFRFLLDFKILNDSERKKKREGVTQKRGGRILWAYRVILTNNFASV
jgi:hypothetical protein